MEHLKFPYHTHFRKAADVSMKFIIAAGTKLLEVAPAGDRNNIARVALDPFTSRNTAQDDASASSIEKIRCNGKDFLLTTSDVVGGIMTSDGLKSIGVYGTAQNIFSDACRMNLTML